MNKKKISQIVAVAGVVLSAAAAGVSYLSTGDGRDITHCLFLYFLGQIFAFVFYLYCTFNCPEDGSREGTECAFRCYLIQVIIQLTLIILLLVCIGMTQPF